MQSHRNSLLLSFGDDLVLTTQFQVNRFRNVIVISELTSNKGRLSYYQHGDCRWKHKDPLRCSLDNCSHTSNRLQRAKNPQKAKTHLGLQPKLRDSPLA